MEERVRVDGGGVRFCEILHREGGHEVSLKRVPAFSPSAVKVIWLEVTGGNKGRRGGVCEVGTWGGGGCMESAAVTHWEAVVI